MRGVDRKWLTACSDFKGNAQQWHELFGVRVSSRIVPDAKHFNDANVPVVIDEILALLEQK